MTVNNKFQLPKPVKEHFLAANSEDAAAFLSTFAHNAVVYDQGQAFRGKAAIKEWSDRVYFGDHLQLEVTNVVQDPIETVVTAISDGDYDKSGLSDPLYLDFHFTVEENQVTRLRIVLSSNGRAVPLPQPIAAYYHACDVFDSDLLGSCFLRDAILHDEEKEYNGPEAISSHILKANKDAAVMTDITDCTEKGGEIIVTATLTGNFEGSPVPLDFHFVLLDNKIRSLNIVLAEE